MSVTMTVCIACCAVWKTAVALLTVSAQARSKIDCWVYGLYVLHKGLELDPISLGLYSSTLHLHDLQNACNSWACDKCHDSVPTRCSLAQHCAKGNLVHVGHGCSAQHAVGTQLKFVLALLELHVLHTGLELTPSA